MDVYELGEWVKLLGSIFGALITLGGGIWWASAVYSKISSIDKNLAKCIESVYDHEGRLVKHSFRLGVIEQKVGIIPVEVE